jgi:hypothetical protein
MVSGEDIIKDFSSQSPLIGTAITLAMETLANADCVCFDVDSTVINEEGIVSSKKERDFVASSVYCLFGHSEN